MIFPLWKVEGLSQLWVSVVPVQKTGGRIYRLPARDASVQSADFMSANLLGSFSHGLSAIATEVTATIEANHLNRVVHATNANVAHLWVLERLSLTHLPASSVVSLEGRPVHAEDDTIGASIDAILVRPSWNPSHRNTTDVHGSAVSSHVVTDVIVAELEQSTT
jgi:hypothetical protein